MTTFLSVKEDPGLQVESFAIVNMGGTSKKVVVLYYSPFFSVVMVQPLARFIKRIAGLIPCNSLPSLSSILTCEKQYANAVVSSGCLPCIPVSPPPPTGKVDNWVRMNAARKIVK